MRVEKSAPVARALANGGDLDAGEFRLQLVQRQLVGLCRRLAADLQTPSLGIDLGNVGEMITNKEGIVGCVKRVEVADRRLVVWWSEAQLDQGHLAR